MVLESFAMTILVWFRVCQGLPHKIPDRIPHMTHLVEKRYQMGFWKS